jgi:hypothetical protein
MAYIEAFMTLGLFGPKVDPRQHAYDILPTYELTDDGFVITVHDLPVKDPVQGGRIKLRWDEVTSIKTMSQQDAMDYTRQLLSNIGDLVATQAKRSIETAMFCEGKKEKPALYMTMVGQEAKLTMGLRSTSQMQGNFSGLGVLTIIEGPDLNYTVIFKKQKPEELKDLLDAFEKAKGILNIKI